MVECPPMECDAKSVQLCNDMIGMLWLNTTKRITDHIDIFHHVQLCNANNFTCLLIMN